MSRTLLCVCACVCAWTCLRSRLCASHPQYTWLIMTMQGRSLCHTGQGVGLVVWAFPPSSPRPRTHMWRTRAPPVKYDKNLYVGWACEEATLDSCRFVQWHATYRLKWLRIEYCRRVRQLLCHPCKFPTGRASRFFINCICLKCVALVRVCCSLGEPWHLFVNFNYVCIDLLQRMCLFVKLFHWTGLALLHQHHLFACCASFPWRPWQLFINCPMACFFINFNDVALTFVRMCVNCCVIRVRFPQDELGMSSSFVFASCLQHVCWCVPVVHWMSPGISSSTSIMIALVSATQVLVRKTFPLDELGASASTSILFAWCVKLSFDDLVNYLTTIPMAFIFINFNDSALACVRMCINCCVMRANFPQENFAFLHQCVCL